MSVFWWVKLDLFSLEYDEVSSSEFWGVYGFSMALEAHLLVFKIVFRFCLRVIMVCLALELSDSWVEMVSV